MTVGELLDRMDSNEITEWMAYDIIDPIGAIRYDLHAAMVMSSIYNVNRGKRSAFTISDFMPDFDPKPKKLQSARQMMSLLPQSGFINGNH